MDFALTDTQQMYADTVSKFVKNEIIPRVMTMEKDHTFPWDIIRKTWELGILNLSIPESVKGYEVDIVSTALIIKELSYGDTGISTSAMCNDLANAVIAKHGTDAQQNAFLGPFAENPVLASFCLTEPGAGSDNSGMTTFIKKNDNGSYLLNGSKCFITNASYASQFTVFCKVGKPSGNLIACVIVPAPLLLPEDVTSPITEGREIFPPRGGKIVIGKPEDKLDRDCPTRLPSLSKMSLSKVIRSSATGDRVLNTS
jgi:acyl-CoA dehydrogenase